MGERRCRREPSKCFSAAGLEAYVPHWEELLREIQPSPPLPHPCMGICACHG